MSKTTSLEKLFDVVDDLVHKEFGILRNVREIPRDPGGPDFFHFMAEPCNAQAFNSYRNSPMAGGASTTREHALAKSIGEAIERYSSAFYNVEEFPFLSASSANFNCVPPSTFALYQDHQYSQPDFPYAPFCNTTPVRWTPAEDIRSGEAWYVPAAMVFMPYQYNREIGEPPIVQPISTGLACHTTWIEAVISAIAEVIERDAFMITWQAGLEMPQVRVETLSDTNRDLIDRFERNGSQVVILNLTMDHGIPTILSVLQSSSPEVPALVFAAATDVSAETAARKSLEELAHTRRLAVYLKKTLPLVNINSGFDSVKDQNSHVRLYCEQTNAKFAQFIFNSQKKIDFAEIPSFERDDPSQKLDLLLNKISAAEYRILVVDLTTPDVDFLGFKVVRALIPGFHPLYMGHNRRALGGHRLWEVPQKLGYSGLRDASGTNIFPHPYP